MITNYFVQHGIANEKEVDAGRSLSTQGKEEVQKVAENLKIQGVIIRKIFHSGKLRARQTADIFAQILDVDSILESSVMNPNDDPQELIRQITQDAVMYIGHLPNMQRVVAKLITGDASLDVVKYQNSAVACVEIDAGAGRLKWFITPDIC